MSEQKENELISCDRDNNVNNSKHAQNLLKDFICNRIVFKDIGAIVFYEYNLFIITYYFEICTVLKSRHVGMRKLLSLSYLLCHNCMHT